MTGETPGLRLTLRGLLDGQDLARSLAGHAVELLSRPSFRAGIVGSAAIGALCARAGMRPVPALVLMMVAHTAAERLWEMAEDIHETAVAQREYLKQREPLVFHGFGCPGHTPGAPAESCLKPDAPSPL